MARKRKPDKEPEKELQEEAEEEALEAEDEAVVEEEAEEAAHEEPAEDEPRAVDDAEDADAPPADEDEAPVALPPRPRTPVFTIVLLILNFLAVPPFVLLAFMDYSARQQWSHATLVLRIVPLGLPLKEEEDSLSAWSQVRPRLRIDSDKLAEAYRKRPKTAGTPSFTEPFQPVDTFDEPIDYRIRPSQIDDSVKNELFAGLGQGVTTLNDEMDRLKQQVPGKIAEAATEYAKTKKDPQQKQAAILFLLMPLTETTKHVEDLDALVGAAQGPALDALLEEAAQRRMLIDLLAPMNVYRPGTADEFKIEKAAALENGKFSTSLDYLKELLQKRFEGALAATNIGAVHNGAEFDGKKRDDVEKRHTVAFMLFAIARLKAPEAKEPLFDKALERAQVVSGLWEFTQAAANYMRTLRVLEDRLLQAAEQDRDGIVVFKDGQPTRAVGFVKAHADQIWDLKKLVTEIEFTKKRINELETQRKIYQKHYEERLALLEAETKRLVGARQATRKLLDELEVLEEELHAAQVQLSDAAQRNTLLEIQIVRAERLLQKGGTK